MENIEIKGIIDSLVNKIVEIPGVIGFVSTSSTAAVPNLLSEDKYSDGIEVQNSTKGIIINIHFVASSNAPLPQVSGQMSSSVYSFLTTKKIKIDSVNLFVRGIK